MITVSVLINGELIYTRTTVNLGGDYGGTWVATYEVDDGNTAYHKREEGAVVLAHKLLDLIKE